MEVEENVYGKTDEAEQATEVAASEQSREDDAWKGSAVLGKFKDVDALAKAYTALQAEFTRRSQRLKELERKAENSETASDENQAVGEGSGAEKLRKNARVRRERQEAFDEFVAQTEGKQASEPEKNAAEELQVQAVEGQEVAIKREESSAETETAGLVEPSREKDVAFVAKSRENAVDTQEELYARASSDEKVRLRIIGEYLSSLGKTGAPLMRGGVGAFAAPPLKARTIDEAGSMALRLFKEGR